MIIIIDITIAYVTNIIIVTSTIIMIHIINTFTYYNYCHQYS